MDQQTCRVASWYMIQDMLVYTRVFFTSFLFLTTIRNNTWPQLINSLIGDYFRPALISAIRAALSGGSEKEIQSKKIMFCYSGII